MLVFYEEVGFAMKLLPIMRKKWPDDKVHMFQNHRKILYEYTVHYNALFLDYFSLN